MKALMVTLPTALVVLTLALMSSDPGGPALAFGVAALASCPHPLAAAWAALGISLALGQNIPADLDGISLAGMISMGLVCAALTRSLSGPEGLLATAKAHLVLGLLALSSLALLYLPDARALLETVEGAPLYFSAFVQDLSDGTRLKAVFRASAEVSLVSSMTKSILAAMMVGSLFVVLVGAMRGSREIERLGWTLAVVTGCGLFALGLAGQAGLIGTQITLADSLGNWEALAEMSTPGLAIDSVETSGVGYIGYSSRPAIDVLRVIGGLGLAWVALKQLRRRGDVGQTLPSGRAMPGLLLASLFLFSALVFLQYRGGVFYILSATLLLTLVTSFLGGYSSTSRVVPQSLTFGALCLIVLAIVAPTAGWVLVG